MEPFLLEEASIKRREGQETPPSPTEAAMTPLDEQFEIWYMQQIMNTMRSGKKSVRLPKGEKLPKGFKDGLHLQALRKSNPLRFQLKSDLARHIAREVIFWCLCCSYYDHVITLILTSTLTLGLENPQGGEANLEA